MQHDTHTHIPNLLTLRTSYSLQFTRPAVELHRHLIGPPFNVTRTQSSIQNTHIIIHTKCKGFLIYTTSVVYMAPCTLPYQTVQLPACAYTQVQVGSLTHTHTHTRTHTHSHTHSTRAQHGDYTHEHRTRNPQCQRRGASRIMTAHNAQIKHVQVCMLLMPCRALMTEHTCVQVCVCV